MKLFYREIGQGHPLLILHGLWGASENWLPVARSLADKFRVIIPDLRNHGQSPHAPEMDYQSMSEDIKELLSDLSLPVKPFAVGHSMGGKTLMYLLLKNPELIEKAAIIDIAPIQYKPDKEHLSILNFMLEHTPDTELIKSQFSRETDQQLLRKNIRQKEWKVNANAIKDHLEALSDWNSTKHYQHPILFIKGADSDYIKDINAIRQVFPQAELKTIPGSGHRVHAEQPIILAGMIEKYFSK